MALLIKDFAIALDRKEPGRRNNSFLRQILGIQNFLRPTCRLLTGATKAAEHNVSYALLSQANLTDKNGRCLFEHHFRNPGSNGTVGSLVLAVAARNAEMHCNNASPAEGLSSRGLLRRDKHRLGEESALDW